MPSWGQKPSCHFFFCFFKIFIFLSLLMLGGPDTTNSSPLPGTNAPHPEDSP